MDYSRIVRAAAVQISPVLYSREGTTEKVINAIADAAQQGVDPSNSNIETLAVVLGLITLIFIAQI